MLTNRQVSGHGLRVQEAAALHAHAAGLSEAECADWWREVSDLSVEQRRALAAALLQGDEEGQS